MARTHAKKPDDVENRLSEACRYLLSLDQQGLRLNIAAAARKFEVKYQTLRSRYRGEHKAPRQAHVSQQLLSDVQEKVLAEWASYYASEGEPLDLQTMQELVLAIRRSCGKPLEKVSKKWARRFIGRHPELCIARFSGQVPRGGDSDSGVSDSELGDLGTDAEIEDEEIEESTPTEGPFLSALVPPDPGSQPDTHPSRAPNSTRLTIRLPATSARALLEENARLRDEHTRLEAECRASVRRLKTLQQRLDAQSNKTKRRGLNPAARFLKSIEARERERMGSEFSGVRD